MENYHVLELIGEGSFGKVYKGRKRFSGQVVALKFIPKVGRSEKDLKNLRREIEIMRNLHHGNIIEMLDSFETDKEVVAVTDYAEGELFQILEDDGQLPEEQVQSIAAQLVSALFYLHSHRILHRDMKPQNILLGKGGIVKLCDFGFARAMSINTLVLTSIKGTPLYMSPELVEEKPYDHTADLWALGCILYELYTGQPPFYTNSIFQLVSLIIKDPVRWPKDMSPTFKDFLQGLLTKNPRHRLSWPHLLMHPFVKDNVTVSEEDKSLPSPFTSAPTASLILEKEKQTKERAHPPGTSKILSKAREKAEKESKKKAAQAPAPRIEAWGGKPPGDGKQEPIPIHPERPLTAEWDEPKQPGAQKEIQTIDPTPRPDRLTRDYEQEYPDIEVESRKVLKREPDKKKKKVLENVKLKEEDADSDDEWQALVEATDPEAVESDNALKLIKERSFMNKLRGRLQSSSLQVLDAVLEGASRLRPVLKIIMNLVTTKCELSILLPFLKGIDCPKHVLTLLDQVLSKQAVKEQAWCQKILVDLVATCHAYFASDVLQPGNEDADSIQMYLDATLKFMELTPKLIHQKIDKDLILREQTQMCIIFLCEVMERSETSVPDKFFAGVSNQKPTLEGILTSAMLDEQVLKRLEEVTEGNTEEAQQRMEDMICMGVACLSALMTLPVHPISGIEGKKQIGFSFGALLCQKDKERFMMDYLLLLNHPSTCYNILKVIYTVCQESKEFAAALGANKRDVGTLLGILQGKVQLVDMECNSVLECVLHLLSVIIIQNGEIPPDVNANTPFLITVFIESQLASHTAASALLFTQLLTNGAAGEVQPEDLLNAALSEFTDLAQICVRTPFNFGVLDGIILLLSLLLTQGELPIAGLYIESGIWSILWHRAAQMLQAREPDANIPIHDIEAGEATLTTMNDPNFTPPDWNLLSFDGLMGALNIAVSVFTKETFKVLSNLTSKGSVLVLSLVHMLNKPFLQLVDKTQKKDEGCTPVQELILLVTQICCFPFAVDTDDETLSSIQICFAETGLLPRLFESSVEYLRPELLELPMGLISRLVLGEPMFIQQFADTVNRLKAVPFLLSTLKMAPEISLSVMCDTISICSHLVRTAPEYVTLIEQIFKGPKGDYAPLDTVLSNPNPVVRSRTCSMLGNMMKHSNVFYKTLKTKPQVLLSLTLCLKDEDPNVRKSASYVIGNATFHSDELYKELGPSISELLSLLEDPVAKTRANAAGALGNMALHSTALCNNLIQDKAVQSVLELACNDSQYGVQECALTALRTMANQTALRKELKRLNAIDKLSSVKNGDNKGTPRSRRSMALSKSSGRHSITTVMSHCSKLIRLLSNESHA